MVRRKRQSRPRSHAIIPAGRIVELRRKGAGGYDTWHAFSCEFCAEGLSSTNREKVIRYALTHTRWHVKNLVAYIAKKEDAGLADAALIAP